MYRMKYDIHPTFKFNGEGIVFRGNGKIICGKNSYICRYSFIESVKGCKVVIGDNCAIAQFVKIYTRNPVADQDFSTGRKNRHYNKGDVIIGNNCWIGANVFIRENVKIGDNSVIGANSVVVKDIPPHSIAVGYPAKVVKFKSYLSEEEKLYLIKKYREVISEKLIKKYEKFL